MKISLQISAPNHSISEFKSLQKSPSYDSTNSNFIGTIDNQSLRFRTNNVEKMIIEATGETSMNPKI